VCKAKVVIGPGGKKVVERVVSQAQGSPHLRQPAAIERIRIEELGERALRRPVTVVTMRREGLP
jgi:hypothetical protein